MKELTKKPNKNPDPYKAAADMLFAYLRDVIYNPANASLDIARLPETFAPLGEGLRYFCSAVLETTAFAKELSVGNLSCPAPPQNNAIAYSMKNLHASLKHLTWQTQQVAKGDYKQRVNFMGDFSRAFNLMTEQLEQSHRSSLDEKTRLERDVNLFLANSPNPVLLFDRQGRLTHASHSYLRHCTNSEIDMVLGKDIKELFAPHVSEEGLTEIEQLFAIATVAKVAAEAENEINFFNNEYYRYFKIQITPMLDMDSNVEGLMMFLIDMTGSILAYREAKRARLLAEQSARAKSDFLARMSHEIRTPMNAILGMSQLALREDVPSAVREHILTIRQAGANLLSIINDILDFSKIEKGSLEILPGDYVFSSLVQDVISIVRMKVISERVQFVVNIDCDMPNALYGDEMRVRQILLNILNNAVKYTESGFVTFAVSGEIIDENTVNLTMEIMDSGRGIKQEDMKFLFSEFSRFDLARHKKVEGTGLGLAIALNLIKAMGGDITAESEYEKGSVFTVVLPQKYRTRDKLASVEKPEEKSVLIYESRALYSNSIVCTLDNLGVYCEVALTESEFYEKITARPFHFIFISSVFFEKNINIILRVAPDAQIVVLIGFGDIVSEKQFNTLAMPVQPLSIVNILNGAADKCIYTTIIDSITRFTAPCAKILIVDDINTNLKVAEGLLVPYKIQVDLCTSGIEAIEKIKSENYDLVFMDHMMPELDGIETVSRIRALGGKESYYKKLPIIALTANAVASAKDMFMDSDFNDFLSKPIDIIELDAILTKWIAKEKQIVILEEDFKDTDASSEQTGHGLKIIGVDVNKGIAASGGTIKQYVQTLAVFYRDGIEILEKMRASLASDNLALYVIYAHALKSASMNIGAGRLSNLASALELAGKQEELAFVKTRNPELCDVLEELLNTLSDIISANYEEERQDAANTAILRAELAQLKTALESFDSAAIDSAVGKLRGFAPALDVGAVVDNLLQCILIGEYDNALELIDDLLQRG